MEQPLGLVEIERAIRKSSLSSLGKMSPLLWSLNVGEDTLVYALTAELFAIRCFLGRADMPMQIGTYINLADSANRQGFIGTVTCTLQTTYLEMYYIYPLPMSALVSSRALDSQLDSFHTELAKLKKINDKFMSTFSAVSKAMRSDVSRYINLDDLDKQFGEEEDNEDESKDH